MSKGVLFHYERFLCVVVPSCLVMRAVVRRWLEGRRSKFEFVEYVCIY